jgi:polysaccharide biosynthesis/export protein
MISRRVIAAVLCLTAMPCAAQDAPITTEQPQPTLQPVIAAKAPETVQQTASKVTSAPYTINAGDQIEVYVWGEERLQRQIRILPDGSFSFPLVGRIVAQGLQPGQIEELIKKGLESQYRGQVPQVTVSVVTPSGLQFSVMGRVNSPGQFTPGRYVNLLEAMSMAGGPSQFANLDDVMVIRQTGSEAKTYHVSLGGIFKNRGASEAVSRGAVIAIQSGDVVIVP